MTLRFSTQCLAIFLIYCVGTVDLSSAENTTEPDNVVNNKNIEQTCQYSPVQCLIQIEELLKHDNQSQLVKYDLLQYRYIALFNLQKIEQLHQETKQWIDQDKLPMSFKITVYIYYAKSISSLGKKDESTAYTQKAIDLLKEMNQVFPSPMRLIELANLHMVNGEVEQAYRLLTELTVKYRHSKNALFQMELYGNLGHAARKLKRFDEAEISWNQAIYWSDIFGNTQQQAVSRYNIADIYESLGQYDNAIIFYQKAIKLANKAKDFNKSHHAKFRLANVYFQINQLCEAQAFFKELDKSLLTDKMKMQYAAMVDLMIAC